MIEQNAMVDALKRLARLKNWNIANAQNSFEELTAARELKAIDLFLHEVGVDVNMFYETDGRVAEVSLNGEKIFDNRDKTTWPSVEIDNQWMKTFLDTYCANGKWGHSSQFDKYITGWRAKATVAGRPFAYSVEIWEADGQYTCTVEGYDEKVGGYRLLYEVTNPEAAVAAIHEKNAEEE